MKFLKYISILIVWIGFTQITLSQYYLKLKSDSVSLKSDSVLLFTNDYRGIIQWERSLDKNNWSQLMYSTDTIGIRIDSTAYYRARIIDGTCNPVLSDTVFLMENITHTNSSEFTVDSIGGVFLLPSGIKVKIPRGAVEEAKEVKVDFISADSVNNLAAISIDENACFLSGISIETDSSYFRKSVKIKMPVQDINSSGIPVLYELDCDINSWLFSDETFIVSPQNKFIEIILKDPNQMAVMSNGLSSTDLVAKSFYIKQFNFPLLKHAGFSHEDPCRQGDFTSESLDLSYDNSGGCVAASSTNKIVYHDCGPSHTESFETTEISPSCVPQLIIPGGCVKVQKGKTASLQLNTIIGNIPLAYQNISVSTSGEISAPSNVTTLSDGNASLLISGLDVGDAVIALTANFDYYLSTMNAVGAGSSESSKYNNVRPPSVSKTTCAIVFDYAEVVTANVSNLECETATVGGNVILDNNSPVTERGVLLNGAKLNAGSGIGEISFDLTALVPGTTYTVQAYATNEAGTAYGEVIEFEPLCVPIVTTDFSTNHEDTRAFAGGEVTEDWELDVTERGVYLDDLKLPLGEGLGTFNAELFDLIPNKTYTLTAYAINVAGTGFGEELVFVIDIDGNIYETVTIGSQIWIKENLKTTRYNDGSSIELITEPLVWGLDWGYHERDNYEFYCWYDNNPGYKSDYGALYNWMTVETGKLCPTGWHVPSANEFLILVEYVGGIEIGGGKLKEEGTSHWKSPNTGATNEFGLTALPGGYRKGHHFPFYEEDFKYIGEHGAWWTSTYVPNEGCYYVGLSYNYQDAGMSYTGGTRGASVRCVKD
ncbi:hypothetical protein E9993_14850 [Labilibacter sediminis]|nr:hypothetical protein E9993_14850 [Labilibacter sediminis]